MACGILQRCWDEQKGLCGCLISETKPQIPDLIRMGYPSQFWSRILVHCSFQSTVHRQLTCVACFHGRHLINIIFCNIYTSELSGVLSLSIDSLTVLSGFLQAFNILLSIAMCLWILLFKECRSRQV